MNETEANGGAAAPVFILSFRQRDELAATLARAGWRVVAARRSDGVERRWLASGASVVIVDARGALDPGLAATEALSGLVEAQGGVLLVMVSRNQTDRLGDFLSAGATQFLTSPVSEAELVYAVRFAEARARRRANAWLGGEADAIDVLGWRYDPARRQVEYTPAICSAIEAPEAEPLRMALHRIAPNDRQLALSALRHLRSGAVTTAFAHEMPGMGRVVQHLQRDPQNGRVDALVEALGEAPDARMAIRDALTGARDAEGARHWLNRRLAARGRPVSVILIGLSRFALVNTTYGRAAGDALLRAVSRRVQDVVREDFGRDALVARMGGSDFLVASEAEHARVEVAAAQLQEALARPFATSGGDAPLGAEVVSVTSQAEDDATSLLRRASEALVEARHSGTQSFPPGVHVAIDQLAVDLRGALEQDEIEILFQPQVEIASAAITGVEALARWRHPKLGELGAEMLFASADRAGLGIAVSEHVQRVALEVAAGWPAALRKLRLSVNITAQDVGRQGFVDALLGRIDASGFPRARLTVEITESGLMSELGEAAQLLAALRTAGCRVAIDDFGTGYSSLAYLKALPLDYLKIDKKLSQDITGTVRDRVVVRGVIDMARSLGLAVIAEGVETEEQLDLLAKEGCQYFQGYLCAEPLTVAALTELVGEGA
ncbi:putative bifunctional diguanylate cyclase/phosphodiesterase [Stakelama marina]|uniref:EAL domain-containing protein n=1 Tax=Stakelama marina TaxID=2826939 RepID=A0A8T4I9K8_9SPHN|nr:EAL domain-containing response regulator [Stakelama marina]MBR0551698.1 EAL domain-containing protein [Stakelama marina]